MRFFRRYSADQDPDELLRPENQVSTPWGSADKGPCDKDANEGAVLVIPTGIVARHRPPA